MAGNFSWPVDAAPLAELALTLLAYEAGLRIQRRLRGAAFANPVLIAVLLVSALLWATGRPVAAYARSVQILPFLLGPATVGLAVPLHRNMHRIRQAFGPVLAGVGVGAATASASAMGTLAALGGSKMLVLSIATKSVTASVALAIADVIGADHDLAVGLSVLTGIIGAVICTAVLDLGKVHDPRARGLATGVAASGIGTARMLALDPEAGAFASLGMGLGGITAGLALPLLFHFLVTRS
jgi:putative effector of murein hydrolase